MYCFDFELILSCIQVSVLQRLEQLPSDGSCDWDAPLSVWQYYQEVIAGKSGQETTQPQISDLETPSSVDANTEGTDSKPVNVHQSVLEGKSVTFRVTCTRGGRKHSFSSMDAARSLGAGLAQHFGWTVQLKNPGLEVLLMIVGNAMTIALALNQESKYKRNITHFGPTTLRSTIAYGLLRYMQ